jgi:uncharacterized protein involved in exopolysaccharide biosynthesis
MEKSIEYEPEQRINNLKETLIILFKHKVKICTVFFVVVLTVTAAIFFLTPVYEAKSTILVKMGREYMNRPEMGDNKPVMSVNQGGIISTEIQILTNRELIEKVIKTMKVETIYPDIARDASGKINPLDISVLLFEKNLAVEPVKNSSVIQVAFKHKDPRIAAQAVNQLVELFREKHLQVYSEQQSKYVEQQLEGYTRKLKESENFLDSFKQKNRVYSLEEQRTLLLKQRMELDTGLKNSTNSITELQKKVVMLRSHLKNLAQNDPGYSQPDSDKSIMELKSKLLALQLNEQELLKKYTENNRLVVNNRKDVELVKALLDEHQNQKAKTGTPLYQELYKELLQSETDLNALAAKTIPLKKQVEAVDREIASLNLSEQNLENLKREKIANEKNYQSYQDRAEESRRLDEMNRLKMANISVIQSAAPPIEPVKQKRAKILLLGILFGAAAGIGSAYLAENISRSFSSPEKVERLLGLPVLLSIPNSEN